ncbi:hypothetical protein GLOIN_2v1881853 [Rhizophagus clarus]|uniref:F-box domain-containing protein n=1 Tax=Rhizophagus clarus TaxID=94130 RepID=A0A8H3KRJ5_9GLOM|nr:hypothetical protein GLOIN_2v1881853 [Rhizophagus clarus]
MPTCVRFKTKVNRLWCRLAIPLLWEDPFSIPTKNYKFIYVYLHNLNDDIKTELTEYEININLLLSNTLFNYPSFIKYLNIWTIIFSVWDWFETVLRAEKKYISYDLDTACDLKRLIIMSLFKIFIENEVNLHVLEFDILIHRDYNSFYHDILELILQNPNFIHNVRNLKLIHFASPGYYDNRNECASIKNLILQIISLHQNLKKIFLSYNSFASYKPLLLSKDYNCSNTLNTIILFHIDFNGLINLDIVFEQLNVLESIHIVYCYSLKNGFIQQIINLTKPFKLKSLFISDVSLSIDESLPLLLQKTGGYLENFGCIFRFGCGLSLKQQLLESVLKYCKNIKFLDSCGFGNQIIHQAFNLIENIKQSLNYLTISVFNYHQLNHVSDNNIECSSFVLQHLGQILPSKLKYLSLILHIKVNDFEVFLQNSQDILIKKLLIKNNEGQDILPYLKEYIMKKKRVKYLAVMSSYKNIFVDGYHNNKDLFIMKDVVEEFKLYDIKVKNYYGSLINTYDFIKEID